MKYGRSLFTCKTCGKENDVSFPDYDSLPECCRKTVYELDHIHLYDKDWNEYGILLFKEGTDSKYTPCLINSFYSIEERSLESFKEWLETKVIGIKKEEIEKAFKVFEPTEEDDAEGFILYERIKNIIKKL